MVASWSSRLEQLTVYSAAQMPHINRTGLSGMSQGSITEASAHLAATSAAASATREFCCREEVCLAWLTMRRGHPVRWIEDRREHLTANANCREHHYLITGYADRDGRLRGIDCEATVDSARVFVLSVLGMP